MDIATEVSYQIEEGIPVPPTATRKGFTSTIKKLKVGQSVVLPTRNLGGVLTKLKRENYGKYVSRRLGSSSIRIWRVSDTHS